MGSIPAKVKSVLISVSRFNVNIYIDINSLPHQVCVIVCESLYTLLIYSIMAGNKSAILNDVPPFDEKLRWVTIDNII